VIVRTDKAATAFRDSPPPIASASRP